MEIQDDSQASDLEDKEDDNAITEVANVEGEAIGGKNIIRFRSVEECGGYLSRDIR